MENQVKLHNNPQDFKDLITFTSEHFQISEVLVEKDYWVTVGLYNLSKSSLVDKVVFKGGTSLSKAHNLIFRFSEDIDLAVLVEPDASSGSVNRLLRDVETACTVGFTQVVGDERERKFGSFRKTIWEFRKLGLTKQYGDAGEYILVEVNSFTTPEPHQALQINSLIARYLSDTNKEDVIREYGLEDFTISVLRAERTFVEKISAIAKHSFQSQADNFGDLSKNIRHVYDLVKMMPICQKSVLENKAQILDLLIRVKADDKKMDKEGIWSARSYKDAPIFKDFDNVWKKVSPAYNGQFKSMLFGGEKLPDDESVKKMIAAISDALNEHE